MASEDPKMGTPCTASKRKHITSTIPQKLEVIKRLKVMKVEETPWLIKCSHEQNFMRTHISVICVSHNYVSP
jgi:hypothetical protein